jgi:hypothetical protein
MRFEVFRRISFLKLNELNKPNKLDKPKEEILMILRSCLGCKFHEIHDSGNRQRSRCQRENCWSEFSKCIAQRALEQFLAQDRAASTRSFSALDQAYSRE